MPLSWHETEENLIIADQSKYVSPDGQPNDMTDFCTALHWLQHDALGEGRPEYNEAIRRCLFCAFGSRCTDLEDYELHAAVGSEIVKPLKRALRQVDLKT